MSLRIHASRAATNLLALFLALALAAAMLLAPAATAMAADDAPTGDPAVTEPTSGSAEPAPADPPAGTSAVTEPAMEPVVQTDTALAAETAPPAETAPLAETASPAETVPPAESVPLAESAATAADPVLTESVPSVPLPSAPMQLVQASVAPLAASLITPMAAPDGAAALGYYTSDFDNNDPTGWYEAGSAAQASEIYSFTTAYTQSGGVWTLGATWTRPNSTGNKGWSIEYTVAPERWGTTSSGAALVPQPDRSQGGVVFIIKNQGYTTERCVYTATIYPLGSTNYPGTCESVGSVVTALDGGNTMVLSLPLPEELVGAQGCPSTLGSTGYIRSWTGESRQIQAWAAPVSVDPPSTCGSISITKASDVVATSSHQFGYILDRSSDLPVIGTPVGTPQTLTVNGTVAIGETDTITTVPAGTDFTLVETAIPANVPWSHLSTVCTVEGGQRYELTVSAPTFKVEPNTRTSCVITNTTSKLTVTKIAIGQQDQAFGFDLDGVAGSDLSIVGTSAPGTSTAILYKPNTQVTVTELLDAVNAGNGVGADWALQGISGGTVNLADLSTTVTTEAGSTVYVTFTNIQTASVVVDKQWVVNQVAYDHGAQPDGLDAALKLTGPGNEPASEQAWSEERTGYVVGDTVVISETTTIDPRMIGCTLTSTITDPLGQTVPAAGYTLTQGKQTLTVTNTVDCDTDLTLVKEVVGGPAAAVDWTLTATGPGTATAGPTGPGTATGSVDPDVTYNLSETPGENTAARTALYRQQGTWACLALDADGDPLDPQPTGWTDAPDASVTVLLGMHVRCAVTNATAQLTIFKAIEGGVLTPDMFELTATPAVMEGLAAESVGGGAPDDGAVADADGSSTFDVRPAHDYVLSEATPGNVNLAYIGLRLERWVNGNWEVVEDPSAAIQVPIGGHDFYRFVNAPPTAFALPITGGIGSDLFGYGGAALLLAALLAAVAVTRSSTFMTARPGGRHV
ncbi:hypothetical protein [Agrococcus sp. KRD186]|uniref:hypothetical protein n=1 Tax=Agrococcus sp. KRD186 TaxID=2729730 RepID=UPI0019D26991|nr:hypothetical protein [Agrococcus sp. KRD186]